jgi:hypothetical protein
MRIILCCFLLSLSGCVLTARDVCDGVPLGTPIANVGASSPTSNDSWCATHPARDPVGNVTDARCCMRSTSEQCGVDCSLHSGAALFDVGPLVNQQSDSAQCCVVVTDGKVTARYVGYD